MIGDIRSLAMLKNMSSNICSIYALHSEMKHIYHLMNTNSRYTLTVNDLKTYSRT